MQRSSRWRWQCAVGLVVLMAGLCLAQGVGAPATLPATGPTTAPVQKGPWIIEHLKAGGLTTGVQLIVSVVGLGVAMERFVHLRRRAILPSKLAAEAMQLAAAGRFDELEQRATRDGSMLGNVIRSAMRHRAAGVAAMGTVAGDVASRELRRQNQKCYPIAVVATIEPLLGLFGTVVGMIEAFDVVALAGSMGNPSILADSIAKALITTEVGLAIAMPALIAYHYLKGRIGVLGVEMEEVVTDIINEAALHQASAGTSAPVAAGR